MHIFYRIRTLATTSVILAGVLWGVEGYAQISPPTADNDEQVTTVTISGNQFADPTQAITLENPSIETEDLVLLVKPLTLEQLQHEAVGWLLLLQAKVQQVSDAEIAIKRENRAIEAEKEVIRKLEGAKAKLEAAEKAQASAAPSTPEYEDATRKVEAAQNALIEAEEAIAAANRVEQEIEENPNLQSARQEAQAEAGVTLAQEVLNAAESALKEIPFESPDYASITEQVNTLAAAFRDLETIRGELQGISATAPEYEVAQNNMSAARDRVKAAALALTQQLPELVDNTSALSAATPPEQKTTESGAEAQDQETSEQNQNSESALDDAASILEQVDGQINSGNLDSSTAGEAEQAIEEFSANIQETVEQDKELKNQLVINVINLQSEQTAIGDRLRVVLDELDAKGGDSSVYRKYIQAISGVAIDVTDTEGLGVRLVSWLKSEEGGGRWGRNLLTFALIVAVTSVAAQILARFLKSMMSQFTQASLLFQNFVITVVRRGGIVVGILLALTALEVSLTPVLAILGGASFVLAFALQSNLSNVASGLMMMWYKPFDVDDHVQVAGITGFVKAISLTTTIIRSNTYDTFTMPNELVWSGVITNSSIEGRIRRAIEVHVSFKADLRRVEQLLVDIATSHPDVLNDPAPTTLIHFEESFVVISLHPWIDPKDYERVPSDLHRIILERFQQENIVIALPIAIELDREPESEYISMDVAMNSITGTQVPESSQKSLTSNIDEAATLEVNAEVNAKEEC